MSPSIEMTRRILQMQWLTLSLYHPLTTPQHPLTTLPFNTPFHATLARNDPSHPPNAMAHSESLPPSDNTTTPTDNTSYQHTLTGPLSLNPHHSHNHAEKELRNNHRCVNVSMSIDESTLLCTF